MSPPLTDDDVRRLPAAVLARPCTDVDPTDPEVVALAALMADYMSASAHCVGIAANQVGRSWRLFVADTTGHRKARSSNGLVVLCNPVVVAREGEDTAREGCLSVPDLTGDTPRSSSVVVSGLVPGSGAVRVVEADAFEARCLQHELDHLAGLLFLDRVRTPAGLHQRKRYG